MPSYIDNLRHLAALRRMAQAATHAERSKPLHIKVDEWYRGLAPDARQDRYTMADLVERFGGAPGILGLALSKLGWERRRQWAGNGPYTRYWVPAGL